MRFRIGVAVWLWVALAGCETDMLGTIEGPANPVVEADAAIEVVAATESFCDGKTTLLELPEDPAERGPWQVGARTVKVGDLTVEVWYPAATGSTDGLSRHRYDLTEHLPDELEVEPSAALEQPCDCFRDVPIDAEHGPYAVVSFIHGFSGFRGQSLEQMTHWASRGFVVVSADHPSIGLKTFLTDGLQGIAYNIIADAGGAFLESCNVARSKGQTAEALTILDALQKPAGDLAFLEGRIDMERIAASGHSAGGAGVRPMGTYPGVRVVAPMSMAGVCDGDYIESALVLGGMEDGIVPYNGQRLGYDFSPRPRRLVGLANAGHMAFTSFCPIGEGQGGILAVAQAAGVEFSSTFLAIIEPLASDGCGPDSLPAELGWAATNYATAAAFEETLLCLPERGAALDRIEDVFPTAVGEYRSKLK